MVLMFSGIGRAGLTIGQTGKMLEVAMDPEFQSRLQQDSAFSCGSGTGVENS